MRIVTIGSAIAKKSSFKRQFNTRKESACNWKLQKYSKPTKGLMARKLGQEKFNEWGRINCGSLSWKFNGNLLMHNKAESHHKRAPLGIFPVSSLAKTPLRQGSIQRGPGSPQTATFFIANNRDKHLFSRKR